MRSVLGISAVLVFCTACSSVWQEDRKITPATYNVTKWRIERSVGRLRKLGLVRPSFSENFFILSGDFWSSSEEKEKRLKVLETEIEETLLTTAMNQLNHEKGYEAVTLKEHEDILSRKLGLSREECAKSLELLVDWAQTSANGATPPEEIAMLVKGIGEALNVDGLVVIQGFNRPPNVTTALMFVPFAGAFVFPLLPVEAKAGVSAAIYEVTSGRIVWRKHMSSVGRDRLLKQANRLFSELEPAMPAILIEEQ